MSAQPASSATSDLNQLYRAFADRLEQIVRLDVTASDSVVEDACQFAWDRLLCNRERVRQQSALAWLARTAVHEAFKLLQRQQRYLSLEDVGELAGEVGLRSESAGPEEVIVQRERLEAVGLLPERQRRMLWLHALGFSYAEIAAETGCTVRTVERQLLRAKRAVRSSARSAGPKLGNPRASRAQSEPRAEARTRRSVPTA
jgi:RNA polymerase sigma factor (sigma-70 family)